MSTSVLFHGFEAARVEVYHNEESDYWHTEVALTAKENRVHVFIPGHCAHKVEALMAACDFVDVLWKAVQDCCDREGMADMKASVEEAALIAGGTEALPESGRNVIKMGDHYEEDGV